MTKYILTFLVPLLISVSSFAQTKTDGNKTQIDGIIELDKIVHDFGDVMLSDGALSCKFKVTNISKKPIAIFNVVTSCGCTNVKWTREPIAPGKSGEISASYTNDEGPYPFDKTLTAYFSGVKKPVILRMRGVSHKKKEPLTELYPIRFGDLGFKEIDIKCGNLVQGSQRGDEINVANLGNKPIKVSFNDITPGLEINISPNPIPANSVAKINYTVTSSRDKWGKNYYYTTPLVNGKTYQAITNSKTLNKTNSEKISIWTFTKEDFSNWNKYQIDNGSQPMFNESTFTYKKVKKGEVVHAKFIMTNKGNTNAKIYKLDADCPGYHYKYNMNTAAGAENTIIFDLFTKDMPKGDNMTTITLTTNSPLRPIINLFIYGEIE